MSFLAIFVEGFRERDKICQRTMKIYYLQINITIASVYISKFRQLAFDINWDKQMVMSWFQ